MKPLIITTVFYFLFHAAYGQSRFEIEIKLSNLKTENNGHIVGGHGFYAVTKEGDPHTASYGIGGVYKLNERHLVKLHLGRHRNGRVLNLTAYNDLSSSDYMMVDFPYNYIQVVPSYSYRLIFQKFIFPFELGFHINKNIREYNNFFVGINKYNYDVAMSAGVQYRFIPKLVFGINGKYVRNLSEYQNKSLVWGTYAPIQYGMELSCHYSFGK